MVEIGGQREKGRDEDLGKWGGGGEQRKCMILEQLSQIRSVNQLVIYYMGS